MKTEVQIKNGQSVAVVWSDDVIITDTGSALDLTMGIIHETGCKNIALNKEAFAEEFFILSTCMAGEILQKFINYGVRLAIYGDFSGYESKALKDFIYESNRGNAIYFQPSAEDAADKLTQ